MRKTNHKSDFDFILPFPVREALPDGTCQSVDLGWPGFDWEARFWTWSKANMFVASCKGGVPANCFNDNGRIHVVLDNHRLGPGKLKVEYHAELPNGIYPDATRDMFNEYPLGVELVDGPGDCATGIEVEYMLPYIKGDKGDKGDTGPRGEKGDPFTFGDFTPDEIALLQKPAKDAADGLSTFASEAQKAEKTRVSNEESRVEAEKKRAGRFEEFEADLAKKADITQLSNVLAADPLEPWEMPDTPEYRQLFIDMWNEACGERGRYNAETGYFELNGLTDITYEEALLIYQRRVPRPQSSGYMGERIRTNIPFGRSWLQNNGLCLFYDCRELEVCNVSSDIIKAGVQTFWNARKLRTIIGVLWTDSSNANCFALCRELRDIKIKVSYSISFQDSPLLSLDSLTYMVANSANGDKAITITVHPDVYAKLTDEANAEWNALVATAAARNITFTTIE